MKDTIRAVAKTIGIGIVTVLVTLAVLTTVTVVAQHRATAEVLERLESEYVVCSEIEPRTGWCMLHDSQRIMLDRQVRP